MLKHILGIIAALLAFVQQGGAAVSGGRAQTYVIYQRGDSYWCEMETPVTESANSRTLGLDVDVSMSSDGNHSANLFFHVSSDTEGHFIAALCDLLRNDYGFAGMQGAEISITLSNGETFTTSEAVLFDARGGGEASSGVAGLLGVGVSLNDLRGSLSARADDDANHRNNVEKFSVFDVRELRFDGNTVAFRDFRTAPTLRSMFSSLRGITYAYDLFPSIFGPNSTTSSIVSESPVAGFSYGGTFNKVARPRTSALGYLRNAVGKLKQCRTGALTEARGGLAVYGSNGSVNTVGVPSTLVGRIKDVNAAHHAITDIHVSETGGYVLLYGGNGNYCEGAPADLVETLQQLNRQGENVLSACFNDMGAWAVVTDGGCFGSPGDIKDFVDQAVEVYGKAYSVTMTNVGVLVCCARGVYFRNVPSTLVDKLAQLKFVPRVIKFTDTGLCIITDGKSKYDYLM